MGQLLLVIICVALALMLTSNYSRQGRNGARALTRHEAAYDLPRLGQRRDPIVARLGRTIAMTLLGTQVGLVLAAVVALLLPGDSGASPFGMAALAWGLGQAGKVCGTLLETRADQAAANDVPAVTGASVSRPLSQVAAPFLLAMWPASLLLLGGLLAWCVATGSAAVLPWAAGLAVTGVLLALYASWAVRRALRASTFLRGGLQPAWTEALRGDAVRAALVLVPGAIGVGVAFVGSVVAELHPVRAPGQTATIILLVVAGLVLWGLTLLAGLRSVRWHAARVAGPH